MQLKFPIVKFTWTKKMNKYISKTTFIIFNVLLFILEIIMVYLLVDGYLTNDYISPNDVTFYEYLLIKFSNLV